MRFASFKKPVNHYFHSMQYCPKRKKKPNCGNSRHFVNVFYASFPMS